MTVYIKRKIRFSVLLFWLSLLFPMFSAQAFEQWQPQYPFVITVPSNPGGGWDQAGRFLQRAIIQEKLSPVSIEVVNKGGAGGIIALSELVARFDSNPYKLMITGFGMTGATIMHNSDFSLQSTTPIARLTGEFQAIGVPFDSPYQSLEQLIADFVENPEKIIWGGGSAGGADHLFINLLADKLAIDPKHINYVAFTGGGEATAALMGGQVTAGVSGYSEWGGVVDAERVRLLGVSSQTRIVNPDIATFVEHGVDVVFQNWRAIVAAPDITEAQRKYLIELVTQARNSKTWQDIVKRNNWQDSFLTGEAFSQFINQDNERTERIVSRSGLGSGGEGYASIGPFFFPIIAGIGLLICSLLLLIEKIKHKPATSSDNQQELQLELGQPLTKFYLAVTAIGTYLLGLSLLGFIYVTPIFIPVISKILGSTALKRDIAVGLTLTMLIVIVFENFLNVIVP